MYCKFTLWSYLNELNWVPQVTSHREWKDVQKSWPEKYSFPNPTSLVFLLLKDIEFYVFGSFARMVTVYLENVYPKDCWLHSKLWYFEKYVQKRRRQTYWLTFVLHSVHQWRAALALPLNFDFFFLVTRIYNTILR